MPTYDNFRVATSDAPTPDFQGPSGPSGAQIAGQQLQQAGAALTGAAGDVGKLAADAQRQANDLRVNDAMNQYMTAQTNARVEVLQIKGKNALDRPDGKALPDEYGEKLGKVSSDIAATLGNQAQKQAFAAAAQRQAEQFRAAASQHMVQQQDVYRKETQRATLDAAVNQGALLWGDAQALAQSKATITRVVDDIARDHGMSPEARDMALTDSLSPLHVGVMKGMITAGMASQARDYYDANSAGMTLQARAQMQGIVKQASDVQAGEGAADAVWSTVGPQGANDAVRIFDMEKVIREKLKDNPDAMKHGIDSVRQRAQAFNAQQAETNAAGVNGVYALIDSGKPLSAVMRSDAWLSLPDVKRHEITKGMEAEAAARESRAAARESRQFVREQRAEKAMLLQNGDAYLRYSDPAVLASMTRQQVEATRTVFGMEGAQHLLQRFDTMQTREGKLAASMDKEDFDHIADQMGLSPFKADTEDKKRALGELKYRVEQLIDHAQSAKKAPLDRQEKTDLMRQEMARKVAVPGWLFGSDQVPVIQLTPAQAGKVAVPSTDRLQIIEALKAANQRDPSNPAYAPTEDNVRRLYLRKQSPAGGLIPAPR